MKTDQHKRLQRIDCIVLAGLLAMSMLGSTLVMLQGGQDGHR